MAAYVQEMRATGRAPKTLRWHQTSLSALRHSLQSQFHLREECFLSGASLRTWLTELSIAPSPRTGATRSVSTVAAYARSARAFCNWLVRQGYVSETLLPKDAVPQALRRLPQAVEPEAFVRLLRACQLPGSARRAECGHGGAQSRHPLALARHRAAGFRIVQFTSLGCGMRLRNRDLVRKTRAPSHFPPVGGWAARRVRLSGSGPSHASLGAYGARGTGSTLAHRAAVSSHQE